MSFVRGTGQSLERHPRLKRGRLRIPNTLRRGSSLPVYGKTQYTAQDPERIAAHAIGYPQANTIFYHVLCTAAHAIGYPQGEKAALASCSRKAAHDGTALESLVACLQPLTQLYTLAARHPLQGILNNERGKCRPLLLRPHKERRLSPFMICMTGTAVPLCLCCHRLPFFGV